MAPHLLRTAALLSAALQLAAVAASACSTDLDCALNGVCQGGTCVCNPGWKGADCSQLDLLPASQAGSLHAYNVSSWGGSILPISASSANDPSAEIHMFASVFVNCGLTSWLHNSYIAHTVSTNGVAGPFNVVNTTIGLWSHNVIALNASTPQSGPAYLIFHIGDGTNGNGYLQPCAPGPDGASVSNGTSQCGLLWFPCDPPPLCDDGTFPPLPGYTCMSYSCSGNEPWTGEDKEGAVAADGAARPLGDDVTCGDRIMDLHLNCTGPEECMFEAAGACTATPGCKSFGISDFLNNYTWAMLFTAGAEGLRPNAQWNVWVNTSAAGDGAAAVGKAGTAMAKAAHAPAATSATTSSTAPGMDAAAGSSFPVSFSTSLDGPWTTVYPNTTSPTNGNNPAPFIAVNGSVYVVFNDGAMTMFRSDTGWQGPYNKVTTGACGGGEDPFIWQDSRGNWHCLYHRAPFADPAAQAIGHAYSPDGFTWYTSPTAAATSVIQYEDQDGGAPLSVTFGKRERPHLLFSSDGQNTPLAFISGVGINPACDPFVYTQTGEGQGDEGRDYGEGPHVSAARLSSSGWVPSIDKARLAAINSGAVPDCGAWVQYQRLDLNPQPAYYDRSWTHVQMIATTAAGSTTGSTTTA